MRHGKGWKWRLIGGLVGIGILTAGTISVIANYQDSAFQPDGYIEERNKKDNQIIFPGQDVSLGDELSDESQLWEQDAESDSSLKPEEMPTSSMLFQTMKIAGDNSKDETENNSDTGDSGDTVYAQDDSGNKKNDGDRTVVVTPGKDSGDGESTPGNPDGQNPGTNPDPDKPGNTPDPDKPGNPDPGNTEEPTTEEPTTEEPTTETPTTEMPTTEEPTTETPTTEAPTTEEPTTEEPTTEEPTTEQPETPSDRDPDTTVPKPPKDDTLFPAEPYPGDDNVDISDQEEYKRYSLMVIGIRDIEDSINELYMGEYLNDQRVLCSVIVYVCIDGEPTYRLTELNDNFKLGSYPKRVTEDSITLDFYYRPGANYDWIQYSYTTDIRYSAKLLLRGWQDGEYAEQYLVPKDNPVVDLYPYYTEMRTDSTASLYETAAVEDLFIGWSEKPQGDCVGPVYTVNGTGAKVLYPLSGSAIPEGYSGSWNSYFFQLGETMHYADFQTLTDYTGGSSTLTIPNGIQVVDLPADIDWDTWTFGYKSYDVLSVPETVLMLATDYTNNAQADLYTFHVKKEYQVDPDNVMYSSYNGMLFNKSKSVLYAVPEEMEELTVPITVTYMHILQDNQIRQIHFQSVKPCKMNFNNLVNTKIYVPAASYLAYLAAWGRNPGGNGNQLLAEGSNTEEFEEDDDAIYSVDRKVLKAVKNTVSGVYVVPEGVEVIAKDAFANCGTIDLLILPASITTLENNSLNGNPPEKIVFLGEAAPDIDQNTFSDTSILQVLTQAREVYEQKWTAILGAHMDDVHFLEFAYVDSDAVGFCYLDEEASEYGEAGAILIEAPATTVSFNAASDKEVVWKEIEDGAFENCQSLYMVELPETVKKIHRRAFAGCESLQGVLSYSEDELEIGEDAFEGTTGLRFVAVHAMNLDCYTYSGSALFYGVIGSTEYNFINYFSPSYYLVDSGNGKLLYGVATDDDGQATDNSFVLGATSDVSGDIVLESGTIEIADGAFTGCAESFTVEGLESLNAVGNHAFEYSGLSGEITLKNAVYIGVGAFQGCNGITKVTVDGSRLDKRVYLHPMEQYVFKGCTNLQKVTITGTGYYDICEQAFAYCSSLTSITFGDEVGIQEIGEGAFGYTALTEITFPASVTGVGFALFDGCDALTKVTMLSETAPELFGYYYGVPFVFSYTGLPDGWLAVPTDCEQTYIDAWKYYMIGHTAADADSLTKEELLEGENQVRAMLGMELLTDTGDPDNTEDTGKTDDSGQADSQQGNEKKDTIAVATPGDASEETTTGEEEPAVKEEEKP